MNALFLYIYHNPTSSAILTLGYGLIVWKLVARPRVPKVPEESLKTRRARYFAMKVIQAKQERDVHEI